MEDNFGLDPALAVPTEDIPIVVTLDELRPYDRNPRLTRNPRYDEIRESIRYRGLDSPPTITQRPDEDHYIIRNGGNTRLAILRELWSETPEKRFFYITCLFKPWKDEITTLVGHLAEGELHSSLTYIEKALGVLDAHALYAEESHKKITQAELAKRLAREGYPVDQSQVSRMFEAVNYLLPAIPKLLQAGMGQRLITNLLRFRRSLANAVEKLAPERIDAMAFVDNYQEVLTRFDDTPLPEFSASRVQDELIGHFAPLLGVSYDLLDLEINDDTAKQKRLNSPPTVTQTDIASSVAFTPPQQTSSVADEASSVIETSSEIPRFEQETADETEAEPASVACQPADGEEATRVKTIQQLVSDHLDEVTDTPQNPAPVPAHLRQGLFPVSDIWLIEPAIDSPSRLRTLIGQLALEIAQEMAISGIKTVDNGPGYCCTCNDGTLEQPQQTMLALLSALCNTPINSARIDDYLHSALLNPAEQRISDTVLIRLYRLIRLARRLAELA